MNETIALTIMAIGLLFDISGCIGLIRLPDVYNRVQASTKCVTAGTTLIIIGALIWLGSVPATIKGLICIAFILVTSATAAHALARAAYVLARLAFNVFGIGEGELALLRWLGAISMVAGALLRGNKKSLTAADLKVRCLRGRAAGAAGRGRSLALKDKAAENTAAALSRPPNWGAEAKGADAPTRRGSKKYRLWRRPPGEGKKSGPWRRRRPC